MMNVSPELEAAAVDAVASEIAERPAKDASPAEVCPNCGAPRTGRYCASCGQKASPVAPTLDYFVGEAVNELLNVDGKIFRSLRLLFTRPGFLTREIFAGRRASYVSPLRLYLIASVLAFAMSALFGTFGDVNVEFTAEPGEVIDPAILDRTAEARSTIIEALILWLPRAMFVLVPLFAGLVMLLRRGSGHTYPQHLYFALHLHAAWFFATALDTAFEAAGLRYVSQAADIVIEIYMVAYFFLAFRITYETGIWDTLWRGATIGLLYLAALMITLAGIAAPTISAIIARGSS